MEIRSQWMGHMGTVDSRLNHDGHQLHMRRGVFSEWPIQNAEEKNVEGKYREGSMVPGDQLVYRVIPQSHRCHRTKMLQWPGSLGSRISAQSSSSPLRLLVLCPWLVIETGRRKYPRCQIVAARLCEICACQRCGVEGSILRHRCCFGR